MSIVVLVDQNEYQPP